MERTYGEFSKESTSEARALIQEAVEWRARTSAGSLPRWWEQEITMTISQLFCRASAMVLVTAASAAVFTANRPIGSASVPPVVAAKEVRYIDHRTRKLSPLPTEDCEALEECEKCGKWHGGACPPIGAARTAAAPASALPAASSPPAGADSAAGPRRSRNGPMGP